MLMVDLKTLIRFFLVKKKDYFKILGFGISSGCKISLSLFTFSGLPAGIKIIKIMDFEGKNVKGIKTA